MQVDALCEVGQGRASDWRQRSTNWTTSYRLDSWSGPGELAVDRVFYNDVDHRTALVHDGVELVLHLVRPVTAGEGCGPVRCAPSGSI